MKNRFHDVTVPVRTGMLHWPGDPEVEIYKIGSIADGEGANISGVNFGLHTGTHMDSPLHFIDNAADIADIPPENLIGPAKVLKIDHPGQITREELESIDIGEASRILFRTRNSDEEWFNSEFRTDYVYLTEEGADYLTGLDLKVVGTDYLSIAEFKNGKSVHVKLLGSGIWIIEGLFLRDVPEGDYEMFALPLKIPGSDGSPVRVVLRSGL